MNKDMLKIILIGAAGLLLLMNFVQGFFSTNSAIAVNGDEQAGRYQISAWAAQISTGYHHSGYYIVDTVTGKVIESKSEAHTSEK